VAQPEEATEAYLRRLLESYPVEPRAVVTDRLASYGAAMGEVLPVPDAASTRASTTG